MKKRLLSLLLTVLMTFGGFGSVFARGSIAPKSYDIDGTCGTSLYWELNMDTGNLHIYGTGAMTDYVYSPDKAPWNEYYASITSITVDQGATTIGNYAFAGLSNVVSISLPETGLTSIGQDAFSGCSSLAALTIPRTVTTIGRQAFSGCDSLTELTVAEGSQYFSSTGTVLFDKAKTKLIAYLSSNTGRTYVIPDTVTVIGQFSFYNIDSLYMVVIPAGLVTLGMAAFYSCDHLEKAYFRGAPPTSVGQSAFANVYSGFCIYYSGKFVSSWAPNGETTWKDYPIAQLPGGQCGDNLYWEYTDPLNELRIYGTGAMYDYQSTNAPWYHTYTNTVIIDEGATSVGAFAFNGLSLYSISLPSTMAQFDYTPILGSLFMEINVAPANPYFCSVDGVLFNKDMTKLILYPSLKQSRVYEVPDGVTDIAIGAFVGCQQTDAVILPESVDTLETYAFAYAYLVNTIIFKGAPPANVGENAFDDCGNYEPTTDFCIYFNPEYYSDWVHNDVWTWNGLPIEMYSENYYYPTCFPAEGEQMLIGFVTEDDTYLAVNYNPNQSYHYNMNIGDNYYGYTTRALKLGGAVAEALETVTNLRYCTWMFEDLEESGKCRIRSGYESGRWLYTHVSSDVDGLYPSYSATEWYISWNGAMRCASTGEDYQYAEYFTDGTHDLMRVSTDEPTDQHVRLYHRIVVDMPERPAGLLGDVDCDGDIDFDDVTLLNAYLLNAAELSEQGLANANVNGDNKVSSADVVALNKLILGNN